jgi:hypothetical protein
MEITRRLSAMYLSRIRTFHWVAILCSNFERNVLAVLLAVLLARVTLLAGARWFRVYRVHRTQRANIVLQSANRPLVTHEDATTTKSQGVDSGLNLPLRHWRQVSELK